MPRWEAEEDRIKSHEGFNGARLEEQRQFWLGGGKWDVLRAEMYAKAHKHKALPYSKGVWRVTNRGMRMPDVELCAESVRTSSRELTLSSCPTRCSERSGWSLEISMGTFTPGTWTEDFPPGNHAWNIQLGSITSKVTPETHTSEIGKLVMLRMKMFQEGDASGWKFRSLSFRKPEAAASLPSPFPGKMEMPHLKGSKHPFVICIKSITNENLLYSSGNSTQGSVVWALKGSWHQVNSQAPWQFLGE